jgi:hypothetical protein
MSDETKYYRTIVTIEVLSEEPVDFDSLQAVHDAIVFGGCSGKWSVTFTEEVSPMRMEKLLLDQGSDPMFLLGDDYNDGPRVRFEYDLNYRGGDYRGVGAFVYVPLAVVESFEHDPDADRKAFYRHTGHDPIHIVHYSLDELWDSNGEPWPEKQKATGAGE